jgi:outer membrane protein assembly factor BamC
LIRSISAHAWRYTTPLLLATTLVGCSSLGDVLNGDKIDYRGGGQKAASLEVPPDLTQLNKESRFQSTEGAVSASTYQASLPANTATAAVTTIAPQTTSGAQLERLGNERWLSTPLTPEQLWPVLQSFWKDLGFALQQNEPLTGVMETEWAENRAKLPQDFIRAALGKALDSLYSTGERDKFRTRLERNGQGTDIYITHRGMVEVVTGQTKDSTIWQPRPADPQLEGEFLSRLMLKLGSQADAASSATLSTAINAQTPARARLVENSGISSLQLDDNFDKAWRRVGVALDRSSFTVEDRDRAQGVYFVRYADPAQTGQQGSGFLSKIFSSSKTESSLARLRVAVKSEGERSLVSVLSEQNSSETTTLRQRIMTALLNELK